jgi:hypothetical protein
MTAVTGGLAGWPAIRLEADRIAAQRKRICPAV